jgi:hypothetical protein
MAFDTINGNSLEKWQHRKPKSRWEDGTYLRELGSEDGTRTEQVQDSVQRWKLVLPVLNLRVCYQRIGLLVG